MSKEIPIIYAKPIVTESIKIEALPIPEREVIIKALDLFIQKKLSKKDNMDGRTNISDINFLLQIAFSAKGRIEQKQNVYQDMTIHQLFRFGCIRVRAFQAIKKCLYMKRVGLTAPEIPHTSCRIFAREITAEDLTRVPGCGSITRKQILFAMESIGYPLSVDRSISQTPKTDV